MTWIYAPTAWLNHDSSLQQNALIQLDDSRSVIEDVFILAQQPKTPQELIIQFSQQYPTAPPIERSSDLTMLKDNECLTPSFVDCHTHLAMNFFRGLDLETASQTNIITDLFFKMERELSPEDVYHFTVLGAAESLLSGTGFVWDHYYHGKAVAEALKDIGLAGCVAPTLQDLDGPGVPWLEAQWKDMIDIDRDASYLDKGIVAALGPHAPETVSDALWRRIVATATEYSLPIHFHMNQTAEEITAHQAQWSCRPTERLDGLGVFDIPTGVLSVHNIHITLEECHVLSDKKNLSLIFCPSSQLIFQYPANVLHWEKAGLRWMVANDTAASNDSLNVQKELRYISGFPLQSLTFDENLQAHTRKEALESTASFRNPFWLLQKVTAGLEHFHPKVKVGRISKGSLANFNIYDLNHPTFWPCDNPLRSLAMSDVNQALCKMVVAGRKIGFGAENLREEVINTPRYQDSLKQANRRLRELKKRTGIESS